jgi:ATP-binding cassette subfamily B protein
MEILNKIAKKNKILVAGYIVTGIIVAFLSNYNVHMLWQIIDKFTAETLQVRQIALYGGILLLLCLVNYLDEYPSQKLYNGVYLDLKLEALNKISKIEYLAYQRLGTGKLVQRVENGAEAGTSILYDFYFCLFRELIPSLVFSLYFIYQINDKIILFVLLGYIFVFLVTNLLLKFLYQLKERVLVQEEKLNHYMVRGFMELVVFRVNRRFPAEIKKAEASKTEIINAKVRIKLIHEAFFTIFAVFIIVIKVGILIYGWFTASVSVGAVVALITLVDNAYTPIAIFNVLFVQYKLDKTAFDRYRSLLLQPEDEQLGSGKKVIKLSGSIGFEKVSFTYGKRKVLEDLCLSIKQGEKIALVGESGSGKSTLLKLLLGFIKPDNGKIWIDAYDLSQMNLDSYYEHISYIPQESPVFDGTLKENLVFDQKVDDAIIKEGLDLVSLSELYTNSEKGLMTKLGERGITLSGGERQKLALARLLFSDSGIIILDEATSAMDNISEEEVMGRILCSLEEKTVLMIAHRLNMIQTFDRIIVMKNGQINGQGSFEYLMTNNSYFRELYEHKTS